MRNEYRRLATLYNIKKVCERIISASSNYTREQIEEDYFKLDAVHHNFAKIGEVINRISKNDLKLANRIPEIEKVVGFKNALIRGYKY